jgi:hypothetical protein
MRRYLIVLLMLGLTSVGTMGCGTCQRAEESAVPSPEAAEDDEARPEVPVGTIEGVVRVAEGVELPAYDDEAMGLNHSGIQPLPDKCSPPKQGDRVPVTLDDQRGAAGVMVNATQFEASPHHDAVTHQVAIVDCRLHPRLVVATRGDRLQMVNETDHPFLPRRAGYPFTQALMKGQSRTVDFDRGGVGHLECIMGAPCGRTDFIVLYHPVHTVTAEGGRFRMDNVPAGQKVRVHAWHPLFKESSVEAEVGAGETRRVEIELALRPEPPADDDSEQTAR